MTADTHAEAADAFDADALDADEAEGPEALAARLARHRVVAVLVAHDGLPWVAKALDALDAQTRAPQRRYVVDTGSTDGTADLLAERVGPGVERLPRDTGFGAAVGHVLQADRNAPGLPEAVEPGQAAGDPVDWVWLLHDDCAPEPDALHHLLVAVDASPSIAVAGPKVLGWADPRHLLEVGVTIARSGARDTGLERHEQDQGQHDAQRSVLAVSTAGMLVRRDVWEQLGGLDADLAVFRDDIDFGWRVNAAGHRVVVAPDAVVHHAEAATHRRRRISAGPDQPHRLDRQNAMHVLLANLPAWTLPWMVLRLTVGTLLRSLGFLIGKDPGFAMAELRALATMLRHPGRIRQARRSRAATRTTGYRDLRGLLSPPGTQLRHAAEVLGGAVSTGSRAPSTLGSGRAVGSAIDAAFDDDGPDDLLAGADSAIRRTLRRPGIALVLTVLGLTLLACRSLFGDGSLLGGALLPAPGSSGDLFAAYTAWWHPLGVGSGAPAAGYAPVLAVAALPLLGAVGLLVDLVVLLAVPLAAATAYRALRGVVRSVLIRLWAAFTYAVLPVATGAVAAGRIGTLLLLVALPLLARPALRLGGVRGPEATWRTAWGAGLALAALAAFAPTVWVLAVVLAVVAAATTARGRASMLRLGAALLVAPVVLVPWTWELVTHPSYLLVEAGVVAPSIVPDPPAPLGVLLLAPGGPGTPATWVGLGVVLAAVAAVLRGRRRRAVLVASVVALAAFAVAVLVSWVEVDTPQLVDGLPGWPGTALVVASAAMLVAAALGAEGARSMLAARSFGWRQPVAVVVAVLCVLGPLVAALSWLGRGAEDPIRRAAPSALPAFVAADAGTPSQPRTLVLRGGEGPTVVGYDVVRGDGVRLGDAEAAPAVEAAPQLPTVVSDLTSGRGGASGTALIPYGVRYVMVAAPGSPSLERTLDATAGLRRLSSGEGDAVWRVTGVTGRVRLIPESGVPLLVPSGEVTVDTALPADRPGGVLALAEASDDGWSATLDGAPLKATSLDGWAQGFVVPAAKEGSAPARLEVEYRNPARGWWLFAQGVLVLVVVVLALPTLRREGEGEDA